MDTSKDSDGAEGRLRAILRALGETGIGTWSYDPAGKRLQGDPGFARLLGLAPEAAAAGAPLDGFLARIHPQDRARVAEAIAAAIASGEWYEADYRLMGEDGRVRWVEARGRVERDAGGRAVRLDGAVVDVTARVENEQALRESEERYRRLLAAEQETEESLRRSRQELQEALEALRDEDRRKDDFLAMLGHELRNPLAAIVSGLRLWREGTDPARLRWIRDVLNRQAALLGRLVEDLLEVSRFSRGKLSIRKEPVRLEEVVEQAVQGVRDGLQDRRHRLSLKVPPDLFLEADPVRLEQVVANLLSNASRYMAPGGLIQVRARREDDQLVLEVQDEGSGLTPESLATVFDLFHQPGPGGDSTGQGLGVGLSLVRAIVQLHGGSVVAASEGPGRGSTFTVRLPGVLEREAVETGEEAAGGPSPSLSAELPAVESEAEPEEPHPPSLSRRILLVDDNRDLAETLSLALEAAGHRVRITYEGHSALAAARRDKPEVVLIDIGLPGMDGRELAHRLREEGLEHVPMYAISGFGTERDHRLSREAGLDVHLVKPIQMDELLALIDSGYTRPERGAPPPPQRPGREQDAPAGPDAARRAAAAGGLDRADAGGSLPPPSPPGLGSRPLPRHPAGGPHPEPRLPQPPPARERAATVSAGAGGSGDEAEGEPLPGATGGPARAAAGPTRVLLVDDSRIVAELTRTLLEERGYEVETAEDATGGLALCGTFAPTVVLADLNLPGGRSGFELARDIVAEGFRDLAGRRPLLVALTAHSEQDVAHRLEDSAFDLLLSKPLDLDRLEEAVRRHLAEPPRESDEGDLPVG